MKSYCHAWVLRTTNRQFNDDVAPIAAFPCDAGHFSDLGGRTPLVDSFGLTHGSEVAFGCDAGDIDQGYYY